MELYDKVSSVPEDIDKVVVQNKVYIIDFLVEVGTIKIVTITNINRVKEVVDKNCGLRIVVDPQKEPNIAPVDVEAVRMNILNNEGVAL